MVRTLWSIFRTWPWALGVIPALCTVPTPAWARELPDINASSEVPDIVVTARKRAESASEVPIALSTTAGATLEDRRLYQLEDINQLSPSLNISYFNPRGSYVSIRGIGHSPASDGLESSVGLFVDGVYLGRPGMAVYDLTDIADVEILRGPQGTLFGKNTSAGAIVITSRAPGFTPEAQVDATVGNHDFVQLRGSISGGLLDDRIASRLALYHTGHAGWVSNPTTGARFNGSDRTGARLQLLIVPSDRFKLRLIGEYHAEQDSCCALVAGSFGPASASYLSRVAFAGGTVVRDSHNDVTTANAPINLTTRQFALSAESTLHLGEADLTAITGYRSWRYRAAFDGDLSSADAYRSAAVPTDDWQFSQEVRIANHAGGRIDWLGGIYFFRQALHSDLQLTFGSKAANFLGNSATPPAFLLAFNNAISSTTADLDSESAALFGQATVHLTPRVDLSMGVRGTYEHKAGVIDRASNAAQTAYHQALAVDEVDPSGTVSLGFAPNPDWHFYASYARGVKSGGINPVAATSADDLLVRPEHTDSIELGAKARLLGGRLAVDIAVFLTRISNYQASYNRIFGTILTNVGDVSTRGVELDTHWSMSRSLTFDIGASYNDAHYVSYANAPCPPEAVGAASCDLGGRPLSDAPRWVINLSAHYQHAIGAGMLLQVGADYGYRSHYYGHLDDGESSLLGDVGIANVRLGLAWSHARLSAQLWVKNAAGVRYLESYPLGGATLYGAYFGTVGAPRSIGVTIDKRL